MSGKRFVKRGLGSAGVWALFVLLDIAGCFGVLAFQCISLVLIVLMKLLFKEKKNACEDF